MKTNILTILVVVFILPYSFSQNPNNKSNTTPNEQIIVNTEFNEQGNLIMFDSAYFREWHTEATNDSNLFFMPDKFPNMDHLLEKFFSDSLSQHSPFKDIWADDFFKEFQHPTIDSLFFKNFRINRDSF
jgi:hypothetical protein